MIHRDFLHRLPAGQSALAFPQPHLPSTQLYPTELPTQSSGVPQDPAFLVHSVATHSKFSSSHSSSSLQNPSLATQISSEHSDPSSQSVMARQPHSPLSRHAVPTRLALQCFSTLQKTPFLTQLVSWQMWSSVQSVSSSHSPLCPVTILPVSISTTNSPSLFMIIIILPM